MKPPPRFATAVLMRLGPENECIIGDLLEEYGAGRSRGWYWRQVLSLVATSAVLQIRARPARTLLMTLAGWATLLLAFTLFGDRTADGMAGLFWNWDRQSAYAGTLPWWPFAITAGAVSYAGFGLSALVVSRIARPFDVPVLLAYTASVAVALAGSALLIEILTRRNGAVPVPHPLFYIVSVTLPHQWRSGLVLVPLVIILCGMMGRQRSEPRASGCS